MRYALLALNFLLSYTLSAQLNGKYTFRHIGTSDGLLNSTVRGIAQDEEGYMWFLTESGLQRYDGHSFVNYPEILDVNPGEIWWVLYADQKGSLIMWKGDKFIRFDLKSHRFTAHTAEDLFPNEPPAPGVEYFEDGNRCRLDSRLWVKYEKNTGNIIASALNYNLDLKHATCWQAFDSTTGDFYSFEKLVYLQIWNPVTKQRFSSALDPSTHPVIKEWNKVKIHGYDKMMIDSKRRIWFISYTHHVYRYDLNKEEMKYFSLKVLADKLGKDTLQDARGLIHFMLEDRQKNIWLATENVGLLLLDQEKDEFLCINSSEKIIHGLRYNYAIRNIFQDRDGNLWLGTDRGINVFNPYDNYFQIIRNIEDEKKSVPKFDIMDVIQASQGEILVGTWDGGIGIYDSEWNYIRTVVFPDIPQHNQVWCFIEQDDGTIWAGCNWGYIHKYNPALRTFTTDRPPETMNSTILRMTKDKNGNIYLVLRNGKIAYWSKKDNRFYAFNEQKSAYNKHPAFVSNIFIDQSGRGWSALDQCLLEYDAKQLTYINSHCAPDSLSKYDIRYITQFNDSTLIIGLRGNGVYLFNKNSYQISRPEIQTHIAYTTVNTIKQDSEGNFWLCAGNALYKCNQDLSEISKINLGYNALTSDFYELASIYELSDGRWVTTTPSEIICFDHRLIQTEESEKKDVLISGLTIMKEAINVDSLLSVSDQLMLPYDRNFISINFTALEYLNAFDFTYSYRLKGIEDEWNSTSTRQAADYTDLKPGEYIFEVKAIYGSSESPITSLPIIITPPWWDTFWFKSLCALALAAIAYYFVRRRIQTIRKEAELKQKISETEMMALRAQMNPHFIFNCLNSIDNLIQSNQKEKATTYLAKFAKLIRAILENSKTNVVPFWKDMEALSLYLELEQLRWDNKINYSIEVDPRIQNGDYKVPPLIIQPFVENAIHHGLLNKKGSEKNLTISAELQGDNIKYTITDNGVGRQQAAEFKRANRSSHKSFGTKITQDRVDIFNKGENQSIHIVDLYDEHQNAIGTKVEVWLTTQSETT